MFDPERLISDCRAALAENDARAAVEEIVRRAVSQPEQLIRVLGEPILAGIETFWRAPDLTILNVLWGPHMKLHPHDHRMWAVIGVYGGREEHTLQMFDESNQRLRKARGVSH